MKIFGKDVSGKTRSELLGRLGMVIVTGVLFVFVGIFSFAWFSRNTNSGGSGLDIAVHTDSYDLLIERTSTYEIDSSDPESPVEKYPIITSSDRTKDKLSAADFSLTYTSTSDAPKLAYELVNEFAYEEKYNLMPGSYGTLTFYLRPATAAALNLTFTLSVGGYVEDYDAERDVTDFNEVDDTNVLDLVKGHFLFFTERTGADYEHYVYGGLIEDGTFSYNTSEHSKCLDVGKTDCYKITLYWEWPLTYYDIIEHISNNENTKRFPSEVNDYLENSEYFFLVPPTSASDDEKAAKYNDGDQAIGSGIDALIVYIAA